MIYTTVVKTFKGGSLSNTSLIKEEQKYYVRKTVSLTKQREYGFNRWYSQLKKTQRLHTLFPSLFPPVLSYGKIGNKGFFDIPYYDDMIDGFSFVTSAKKLEDIKTFFDILFFKLSILHKKEIKVNASNINLYLYEVIDCKLNDSMINKKFKRFTNYPKVVFNDNIVPSFITQVDVFKKLFTSYYNCFYETFTHGNLTLENILYNPDTNKIKFIDLYDEIIIDNPFNEISQLLQSCNSKYELYNSNRVVILGNRAFCKIPDNRNLDYFNLLLKKHIKKCYTPNEFKCIQLFEISQFIHMLPFKARFDTDKTILFYTLASKLLNDFKEGV